MLSSRPASSVQQASKAWLQQTPHFRSFHAFPGFRISPPTQLQRTNVNTPKRLFSSTSTRQTRYNPFRGDSKHPWDISKWDEGTKVLVGIGVGALTYLVYHLEQVPETGRWRYMDISPKYEAALRKEAHLQISKELEGKILPENHPLTRHVRKVVTRILTASNLGTLKSPNEASERKQIEEKHASKSSVEIWDPDTTNTGMVENNSEAAGQEWHLFVVNDDKNINAAASFGNIIVFTGILPVAQDEQGLAAVLGHEIGHVVARHNSERYSSAKLFILAAWILEYAGFDFGLARIITTFALDLPNSRTQEFEADKIGLKLCAKACYDPGAAPQMFARLGSIEKAAGRYNVGFLYTHPTSDARVKRLQEMLPEAYAIQATSPNCGGVPDSIQAFRDTFASAFTFGGRDTQFKWT